MLNKFPLNPEDQLIPIIREIQKPNHYFPKILVPKKPTKKYKHCGSRYE